MAEKISMLDVLIFLFLIFSFLTYNPSMATLFGLLLSLYFFLSIIDPKISYPVMGRRNWLKSFALAVGGYVALIVSASVLLPLLRITGAMSINDAFGIITSTQSTIFSNYASPVLEAVPLFYVIIIAFLIPRVETITFGRLFEFLKDRWKINIPADKFKTFGLLMLVSAMFLFLHLQAKIAEGTTALFIVGLFMFISLILIIIEKQMTGAILLHVIANLMAVWQTAATAIPWMIVIWIVAGIAILYGINFRPVRRLIGG